MPRSAVQPTEGPEGPVVMDEATIEAPRKARHESLLHWKDLAHERLISALSFNAKLTSRVSKATQNELWSAIVAAGENYYEAVLALAAFEKSATVAQMENLFDSADALPR